MDLRIVPKGSVAGCQPSTPFPNLPPPLASGFSPPSSMRVFGQSARQAGLMDSGQATGRPECPLDDPNLGAALADILTVTTHLPTVNRAAQAGRSIISHSMPIGRRRRTLASRQRFVTRPSLIARSRIARSKSVRRKRGSPISDFRLHGAACAVVSHNKGAGGMVARCGLVVARQTVTLSGNPVLWSSMTRG